MATTQPQTVNNITITQSRIKKRDPRAAQRLQLQICTTIPNTVIDCVLLNNAVSTAGEFGEKININIRKNLEEAVASFQVTVSFSLPKIQKSYE